MTATAVRPAFSLRTSVSTVVEFCGFAINALLYQRGVYPADSFGQVHKYGVPMMVSKDADLNRYLGDVLGQVAQWLASGQLRRLVLTVNDARTDEVLERWSFDIDGQQDSGAGAAPGGGKSEDAVRAEIQALLRQITGAVSALPVLTVPCAFDLLVYCGLECDVPADKWELSDPRLIANSGEIKLRSFSTSFHRVGANVTFHN